MTKSLQPDDSTIRREYLKAVDKIKRRYGPVSAFENMHPIVLKLEDAIHFLKYKCEKPSDPKLEKKRQSIIYRLKNVQKDLDIFLKTDCLFNGQNP